MFCSAIAFVLPAVIACLTLTVILWLGLRARAPIHVRDGRALRVDHATFVLGHAGQVGPKDEVVALLEQVHRGHPAAYRAAVASRRVEDGVEEAVHLALQRVQLTSRIPAHNCHVIYLLRSNNLLDQGYKT